MATVYEHVIYDMTSPGLDSPPGMVTGKSSKSSSFLSIPADDHGSLADIANFEDIGLDDVIEYEARVSDNQFKGTPNPYSPNFPSDLRNAASLKRAAVAVASLPARDTPRTPAARELATRAPCRRAPPSIKCEARDPPRPPKRGLCPEPRTNPLQVPVRRSTQSLRPSSVDRRRTLSPASSLGQRDPNLPMKIRRSSWQSSRERKTALQLELECDEDDGDDIPDGLILDNVPISSGPPFDRSKSQTPSKASSPERSPDMRRDRSPNTNREKTRSVGNGTPPVAVAQGSLRWPAWKSDSSAPSIRSARNSGASSPVGLRAKSWTAALAELNAEAKELTEKLGEHSVAMEHKLLRASTWSLPMRKSFEQPDARPRHQSALTELPPLRRTNIMIDPLPVSKEKEAVLSRTRPSWLPPKDPAEERRHLKQYQRMMELSREADCRREAVKRARSECRDTAADSLMHLWEDDILPRWNDAIRERRTRELWWRGIAPRSRGAVWSLAIGNDLGLTQKSYEAALSRAHEADASIKAKLPHSVATDSRYAAWFEAIDRDVEEYTWRDLRIFQTSGPLHQGLIDVLRAYAMYRSDIGYISGCNTIAALLLLNLPSPNDAFVALANLLNRPLPLSFYACDVTAKASAYNLLMQTLSHKSPALSAHLVSLPYHDPDFYLCDVITALFTSHIALDEAARLWDVYVFEGDALIVHAIVAFLLEKEMALLGTKTMEEVKDVLNQELHGTRANKLLVGNGHEERWMTAVREAGKV